MGSGQLSSKPDPEVALSAPTDPPIRTTLALCGGMLDVTHYSRVMQGSKSPYQRTREPNHLMNRHQETHAPWKVHTAGFRCPDRFSLRSAPDTKHNVSPVHQVSPTRAEPTRAISRADAVRFRTFRPGTHSCQTDPQPPGSKNCFHKLHKVDVQKQT